MSEKNQVVGAEGSLDVESADGRIVVMVILDGGIGRTTSEIKVKKTATRKDIFAALRLQKDNSSYTMQWFDSEKNKFVELAENVPISTPYEARDKRFMLRLEVLEKI
ncbi:hypothetical protein COEREDRAFT_89422 [Coemansia reversa NRRL 1564]|uniref:Uncharacterized protein n=1 Tax=Coemansia reversa (strain ATCC 12441 / NRRL 1564) TaxID=763665 RepID=A0A2G5B3T1_COERN|nr:hypothetical protein COEREDRAFT_89422 [Coemansia reversa NRRL 1564]|eukprot:PIA13670.1 hypothetical protein COEREDRAFT_89422 [Coemansia reversa NRRL 1564]